MNPGYQQLFPNRLLRGLPVLQALPEIASQPIYAILKNVYETGETYEGKRVQRFADKGSAKTDTKEQP